MIVSLLRATAYALFVFSLVPVVLSILGFGKARNAPYYSVRRDALKRASRWALTALVLLALALVLLILPPFLAAILPVALIAPPWPPAPTVAPPRATPRRRRLNPLHSRCSIARTAAWPMPRSGRPERGNPNRGIGPRRPGPVEATAYIERIELPSFR